MSIPITWFPRDHRSHSSNSFEPITHSNLDIMMTSVVAYSLWSKLVSFDHRHLYPQSDSPRDIATISAMDAIPVTNKVAGEPESLQNKILETGAGLSQVMQSIFYVIRPTLTCASTSNQWNGFVLIWTRSMHTLATPRGTLSRPITTVLTSMMKLDSVSFTIVIDSQHES